MDELHNAGMMKNNNASNNNNNDNTNQAIIILLIKYGLSLSSNQIIFLDSCTFSKRALQQLLPAEDEGTWHLTTATVQSSVVQTLGSDPAGSPGACDHAFHWARETALPAGIPGVPMQKTPFFEWVKKLGPWQSPLSSNNKVKPATILGSFFPHEPGKKRPYFSWNTGCLMTGSLLHGLWNNLHINWVV